MIQVGRGPRWFDCPNPDARLPDCRIKWQFGLDARLPDFIVAARLRVVARLLQQVRWSSISPIEPVRPIARSAFADRLI